MKEKKAGDKKEKKAKKDKKERRADSEGVHKSKTEKKDRKESKAVKGGLDVSTALIEALDVDQAAVGDGQVVVTAVVPVGALVPFANPLADDKVQKKVLKSVKKGG